MRGLCVVMVALLAGCGGSSGRNGDGGMPDAPATEAGDRDGGNDGSREASTGGDGGCVPTGTTDKPDDTFTDTNCDGIDGDIAHAIFVAPTGNDTIGDGSGSMQKPFATLGAAIPVAKAAGKDVYIAGGSYSSATRTEVVDGVSVYGGYDANNGWTRNNDHVATLTVDDTVGLHATGITTTTSLDRVSISSGQGTQQSGGSSIALLVINSPGLVVTHCAFRSAPGVAGTSGLSGVYNASMDGQKGAKGGDAVCQYTADNTTKNPLPPGGAPGHGGACNSANDEFAPDGAWGEDGSGYPASSGQDGQPGAAGSDGLGGQAGALDATGTFTPGAGTDGTNGQMGTGGSGGDGAGGAFHTCPNCPRYCFYVGTTWTCNADAGRYGGGGGGGGGAGCYGRRGRGGSGGGASIAIVVVNSALKLMSSTIGTNRGGNGGTGGTGSTPGKGGDGGDPGSGVVTSPSAVTCPGDSNVPPGVPGFAGKKGGAGGRGGHGGGGSGGPSVGVWIIGPATPNLAGNTFDVRTGGSGMHGGDYPTTDLLKGADGFAHDTYFQQ